MVPRTLLLIFAGAGLGAVLRYLISQWAQQRFGASFPYGTLLINISGSLLLGLLYTLAADLSRPHIPPLRLFLGVGLLGGYTTFSSFSYESYQLLDQGRYAAGALYMAGSALGCVAGYLLGVALGRGIRLIFPM